MLNEGFQFNISPKCSFSHLDVSKGGVGPLALVFSVFLWIQGSFFLQTILAIEFGPFGSLFQF